MFKSYFNSPTLEKSAFEFNIDPATMLATAVGLGAASAVGKHNQAEGIKRTMSSYRPKKKDDYYQQVENLNQDVQIIFTPLGVLYVLKEGSSELVVDSIDIGEMSQVVRDRYNSKDKNFFKNVMMNKIRSDVNLVERHFASRMIERNNSVNPTKQASELADLTEIIEKIASIEESPYIQHIVDDEPITVRAKFSDEMDINKVASFFGEKLQFPNVFEGLKQKKDDKLTDPRYLSKEAKVKYLPDRVLFVVDDLVVAQLAIGNMNEFGYKAFRNNDDKFFHSFFSKQIGAKEPSIHHLFKQASEANSLEDLFVEPMVHIEVYYYLLNERFGSEWLSYDPEILIDAIESEFLLTEPIAELVVNKIWTLQAVNNPAGTVFKNVQSFEKMVRAVNSKPIDFGATERNISLGEFAFALRVFQSVTPFSDVYDQFSQGVGHYVADVLAEQNRRLIDVNSTGTELKFFKWIDSEVKDRIFGYLNEGLTQEKKEEVLRHYELIAVQSKVLLKEFRDLDEFPKDFEKYVKENWKGIDSITKIIGDDAPDFVPEVAKNIEENIAVDVFLKYQEEQLKAQLAKFVQL